MQLAEDNIISVVIRVRNAEKDLRYCLNLLRQQHLPEDVELEIVVVDNESTDNSAQVAREHGAIIVSLPVEDFSWGRALNRGIAAASGEIILLLSADAYPSEHNWIMEMTNPFADPQVAVAYGRQVPRPDAPLDEIVRLKKKFGVTSFIAKQTPHGFTAKGEHFPASNACAAIRKKIWEEISYDENIEGGEDGVWTYDIFKKGYFVSYQATSCVYHSHDDSVFRNAWRHLELLKKNATINEQNFILYSYVRFLLWKIKTRICNFFYPDICLFTRIKGILFLPFELLTFCLLAFFFNSRNGSTKFRRFFWDK